MTAPSRNPGGDFRQTKRISTAPGSERRPRSAVRSPGPGKYDRALSADERRADQRRRLIVASADVFASQGFAKASVDQIIRRTRMSRRTFYEHFRDLRHALLEVYDHGARIVHREVEDAVAAESKPVERARAGIEAFFRTMQRAAPLARVLFNEIRAAGPACARKHEDTRSRFVALWMTGQREAFAAGLLRREPDEITAYALTTAVEAVALRYLERGEEARMQEAVPALVTMTLAAGLFGDRELARFRDREIGAFGA